jgi:hypothetical protein
MAGWLYSLSIIFIFQSFDAKSYTPSLAGLMAEINDPTAVYNNPGALGFLKNNKRLEINVFTDLITEIESRRNYSNGYYSSYPTITVGNRGLISLYAFGFYFAMKGHQNTWFPVVARRFGSIGVGFQLWDNSSEIGVLLLINDKLRVAVSGNVIYDPVELRGQGGLIYQPSDWYNIGIDILPSSKSFRIVNSFLCNRFGFDKVCMGLKMNNGDINPEWKIFLQGIFSFKYFHLAVGWNSGIKSPSIDRVESIFDFYGFNMIGSMRWGF